MATNTSLFGRMALGVLSGLAGTIALQKLMSAVSRRWPESTPPMRGEPGRFMVEQAEAALPTRVSDRIPEAAEKAVSKALGLGYGMTFGALYAAVRPDGGRPLSDGLALGLACWAAGYLGWLPATGLMPPVWQHSSKQVAVPIAEHLAFGIATVATYDALRPAV